MFLVHEVPNDAVSLLTLLVRYFLTAVFAFIVFLDVPLFKMVSTVEVYRFVPV